MCGRGINVTKKRQRDHSWGVGEGVPRYLKKGLANGGMVHGCVSSEECEEWTNVQRHVTCHQWSNKPPLESKSTL
ncbi:Uncharacterized protein TCM_000859 [Theobroma cacao]|uniref:Uncharacterized protein n=1 Tax=Theobroma cacao TaxID=3641 RepID=A0A061DIR7_THECC|nr:Uncharacterized protein TCM_000859 [Theobroma cacao]